MTKDELLTFIDGMPDDMDLAYEHPEGPWARFLTIGELKAVLIPNYVPLPRPELFINEAGEMEFPF